MSMVEGRERVGEGAGPLTMPHLSPPPSICPSPPMHPIAAEGGGEIPTAMRSTSPNVFPGHGRVRCWGTRYCANGAGCDA